MLGDYRDRYNDPTYCLLGLLLLGLANLLREWACTWLF